MCSVWIPRFCFVHCALILSNMKLCTGYKLDALFISHTYCHKQNYYFQQCLPAVKLLIILHCLYINDSNALCCCTVHSWTCTHPWIIYHVCVGLWQAQICKNKIDDRDKHHVHNTWTWNIHGVYATVIKLMNQSTFFHRKAQWKLLVKVNMLPRTRIL